MKEKNKENKKSKRPLNRILLYFFAITFLVSTSLLVRELYQKAKQQKLYEELATEINQVETESEIETIVPETETETEEEEAIPEEAFAFEGVVREIDWEALQKENEDIYAWIYIPDTNIDYPILQHPTEPSYYLNHNLDHSTGRPGCIYTQNYNSKDFTDPNTVIYGHNMKNKSMFATLHQFEDNLFFEEHPYVYIYTPEAMLVYEVFAAYEFSDAHVLLSFDYSIPESFELYLNSVRNIKDMNSHMRDEVSVTAENHIITLSTCVSGKNDKRWLVQGVLLNEQK